MCIKDQPNPENGQASPGEGDRGDANGRCARGAAFATALPANASLTLVASAVALVYLNALVWHLFLALAFSHPRVQAAYARHTALLGKLAGVLVGAFGVKLIVATVQEFRTKVA